MKPLFDVCLITKNEAKTLPLLVASLKEFQARGGQINVCDTGSTDNTPDIARLLGCKVKEVGTKFLHTVTEKQAKEINDLFIVEGELPIVNGGEKYFDFASARNAAVDMAESDWVCTVDADEQITKMDIDKINSLIFLDPNLAQFEYNFVFSHNWDGSELVKFTQSKFYNKKKMHWVGIIHELVTPIAGGGARYMLGEEIFKLEHWQNQETNRSGYLRGLAVDCYNHQDNDRNSHYFARELLWNGRLRSAIKEFKRHVAMNRWPAEKAQSLIHMGDAYGQLNETDNQISAYLSAYAADPNRRVAPIRLARFYLHNKQYQTAVCYAIAAMQIPWSGFYAEDKAEYENAPHEILYQCYGWLGNIPEAQKHILICLEYQNGNPMYMRDTQFYFPYPANNISGWMAYKEQLFLYDMAKRMESVIELGSWKGKSTHALCSSGCPSVTAIDHWKGSKDEQWIHREAQSDLVFQEFKQNLAGFTNLKYINDDINNVVDTIPDKSVDMIFIDAGHTYEEVKNDIRKWKGKAKILLCGHDYTPGWPGVMQAVDEELSGPDGVQGTIWYKWINNPKVSIVVPTLGRPDKLHRLLESIKENAGYHNYEVVVGADEPRPNNIGAPKMVKKLTDKSTGDLVMFLGNDCVMKPNCVQEAVWAMARKFPDLDGMVGINDEYWPEEGVAAHWMASKKLLPYLDGEFFHTGYFHTGCDNELLARVEMIGKYAFAKNAKIFHDHPMMAGRETAKMDEFYEEAYASARHDHDNQLYAERAKKYGFENRKWV